MSLSRSPVRIAATFLVVATIPMTAAPEIDLAIRTYTAVYEVFYQGRSRGSSTRSVAYDTETGNYTFRSVTELRGFMLRMIAPRSIIEHSEFRSRNGTIAPLEFRYQDGTRRGENNVEVRFDREVGALSVANEDTVTSFDAGPGTLDPGTVQVQVMLNASRPHRNITYEVTGEIGPQQYRFSRHDNEIIETSAGSFDAVVTAQQRDDSSRKTLYWNATELDYLPVRIEQRRNDETRLIFLLESVEWLDY